MTKEIEIYLSPRKEHTKEEKINFFEKSIQASLENRINVSEITKNSFNDLYVLFDNPNLMVAQLPIFRYNGKVYAFGIDQPDNVEYLVVGVGEIEKYLEDGFTVVLYELNDEPYESYEEFKYRILKINENL